MKREVGIVNYESAGNLYNIEKAIQAAGASVKLLEDESQFVDIARIVIPGVGSFANAMVELRENGLADGLRKAVLERGVPVLGICLGMQVLANIGFEHGETNGLSIINGEVRKIKCKGVIPHMGFNHIEMVNGESQLFKGIKKDDQFYFMHSYELCNYTDILALSQYVGHQFVSAIEKDNIYGVQFHPEKSRAAGLQVFTNFVNISG